MPTASASVPPPARSATPARTGSVAASPAPADFVAALCAELAGGEVQLPSFPDVVDRVRAQIDDDRATHAQIGRLIAADAALAARILRLANSATFNPSGRPIADLTVAVGRIGHEMVRCAAISFALQQMKQFGADPELRPVLQALWKKGTLVAALAYVLAKDTRAASADVALVTGLLHDVGRLYVVARAHAERAGYRDCAAWDHALHGGHPRIGAAILRHWRFPDEVGEAVAAQFASGAAPATGSRLPHVLVCAIALVPCSWNPDLLPGVVESVPAFASLGVDAARGDRLLASSAEQIQQLRDALAGV